MMNRGPLIFDTNAEIGFGTLFVSRQLYQSFKRTVMKNILSILAVFLLVGGTAFALPATTKDADHFNRIYRGYGNSFIFVEQGIEFAVFPDGQFDFNVNRYGPEFGAFADFGGVSISFNTGYSYDAYVQYDDYGAVIQIENVPIYYDYYGRIIQAGSVRINYNGFGRVARVGGLFVHYNRFNRFSHCTGFINVFNRAYIFRPWHTYYIVPAVNYCVVYNRPYRRYYAPVRHAYYRPYRDNFRPRTSVSYVNGRRGDVVRRTDARNVRYDQARVGRRGDVAMAQRSERSENARGNSRRDNASAVSRGRPMQGVTRGEVRNDSKVKPRGNSSKVKPRGTTGSKVKPRGTTSSKVKPRGTNGSKVKPRGTASTKVKPRGTSSSKVKPRGQVKSKPQISRGISKQSKVRTAPSKRTQPKSRVSTSNKRKTSSVSQRSKQSRAKVSRSSGSSKQRSTVRRRN